MVDLTDYLWIVWLAFIFVLVIIELITLDFTFLMIAAGSVGGLGANLLGAPWWVQIITAAAMAVLLLLVIRPLLLRVMKRGADPALSNVAALIGMGGRVVTVVGETGGLVRLANGETWTARLAHAREAAIESTTTITVTAIDGSTAVVTRVAPLETPSANKSTDHFPERPSS